MKKLFKSLEVNALDILVVVCTLLVTAGLLLMYFCAEDLKNLTL